MSPSVIRVRLSPKWIKFSVAFSAVGVAVAVLTLNSAPLPFLIVAITMMVAAIIVYVLLVSTGTLAYMRADPTQVTFRYNYGLIRIGPPRRIPLHVGDALVVTREHLFIWRYWGQYEQVRVDAKWADPRDWEQLRAWAASIWPQPTDHTPRRAIIE